MIGGKSPHAAHQIDPSNHLPACHKLLTIRDSENDMHHEAHHHPSNLVDYDDLEILFHVFNWIECDESQSPPSLFLAVMLGIRNLIIPINRN